MSIRSFGDLSDNLDYDLAWRKKELSAIKYYVDQAKDDRGRYCVLARCGVTILYAHWEGFVKHASRSYLEYIAMQRLRNDQLQPYLLTLSLVSTVSISSESHKYSDFGKFTDFFISKLTSQAKLPFRSGLSTESNLSSKVLKEITWCLGIDYTLFESKEKFIDSHLLEKRNHIAHGKEMYITPDDFEEMRTIVIEMMTNLKTELENSAILRKFVKN